MTGAPGPPPRRAKPEVRLVAVSAPLGGPPIRPVVGSAKALPVLAVKTSQGKVRQKGHDYYIAEYPRRKPGELRRWLLAAVARFPSVLEHVTFTFLIRGISRVCSHQLVRHRLASYTQESQRYAKQADEVVVPETVEEREDLRREFLRLCEKAYRLYERMIEAGIPLEDARYVLPQAFTTTILMTVNLRELLHIAKLRLAPEAQWEIREVARQMIEEAKTVIPEIEEMLEKFRG